MQQIVKGEKLKRAPNNEALDELRGVPIPATCRKLRYCSVMYQSSSDNWALFSNSGIHIHDFATLAHAEDWYEALVKHRRLPWQQLEFRNFHIHAETLPQKTLPEDAPHAILKRYSNHSVVKHHFCNCGAVAMPGEETCYSCKTE